MKCCRVSQFLLLFDNLFTLAVPQPVQKEGFKIILLKDRRETVYLLEGPVEGDDQSRFPLVSGNGLYPLQGSELRDDGLRPWMPVFQFINGVVKVAFRQIRHRSRDDNSAHADYNDQCDKGHDGAETDTAPCNPQD